MVQSKSGVFQKTDISQTGGKKTIPLADKKAEKQKKLSASNKKQSVKSTGKKSNPTVSGKKPAPVKKLKKELTPAEKKLSVLNKAEKRKILELKKELENLNKKTQEEVSIKDAEGRSYCQDENCDQPAVTDKYCRYHYLSLWKYRQTRKKLLDEKYLENSIKNLIKSFGERVVGFVLRDCRNEKAFEIVAREMNFSVGEEVTHPEEEITTL